VHIVCIIGSTVASVVWQWTHCNDVHGFAVSSHTGRWPV